MTTKKFNLAALSLAFIFAACGDEITTEKITQVSQESVAVVADVSELPDCTSENEGRQALIKGEPSLRICVDGKWFATYSDYVDMLDNFKCAAEKLQDDSGLKILCNGDSVGVVFNGTNGSNGQNGNSAYEIAVAGGYKGTEADWLASLKGADGSNGSNGLNGKSAYEIAVAGGYKGTEADWLASLKGADGSNGSNGLNGKSAYEIAVAGGYKGTEAEWLASLKGADGSNGSNGLNGKSAYEIAVAGGYKGTEAEWLASLKGDKGESGEGCSIERDESLITITCGNQNTVINVNEIVVTSNLGTCSKVNENQVGIFEGVYYVCNSNKWIEAPNEIIVDYNLGQCSSVNENTIGKYENRYYVCRSNKWEETTVDAVIGACSDINESEIDNYKDTYYICHSNKWTEASIGTCSSVYEKNIYKYEGVYYICKSNKWTKASELEYDTYGLICNDNGSIINGSVISANKYVCDNDSFRNAEEKEILLGESCTGFTMWKTVRTDYTETQDSVYYCSGTNWEVSVDRHYDVFTDSRDGETYRMVTIGNQTWMAENLNYNYNVNSAKSRCRSDSIAYCNKNGRLYTWSAAMDSAGVFGTNGKDCGDPGQILPQTCSATNPVRGVCPEGWHLPDTSEWRNLFASIRDEISAGRMQREDFANIFNSLDDLDFSTSTFKGRSFYIVQSKVFRLDADYFYSNDNYSINTISSMRYDKTVRCIKDSE